MSSSTRDSSPRISRSSLIRSTRSACSCLILSASSAVRRCEAQVEDRLRLARARARSASISRSRAVSGSRDRADDAR